MRAIHAHQIHRLQYLQEFISKYNSHYQNLLHLKKDFESKNILDD